MTGNKNIQDGRDQTQVNGSEDYEFSYLEEKLGVSKQQIKEAIAAVGNSPEEVEAYLRGKY